MKLKHITLFLMLFMGFFVAAQNTIPKDYFANPLDIPLVLSGTFGELRSNHFHSGLDIKTQRKTGFEVKAAAAGSVSRIKISHFGYGKAIYIAHPNGYTTVYAHLKKFSPEIEAYIKKKQYTKESFEIEVFPKANELKVAQGDLIALSGNTGGSGGPHLHFEIRDKNARPMNPFLFGIQVEDNKRPVISRVMAYPLDERSHINGSSNPVEIRLTQKSNGEYVGESLKAKGRIGFGATTFDQQDLANNKNGVYRVQTSINGASNFEVTMNKFSFAETRYLNRMIDYGFFQRNKSRIQKLFVELNNPLSIFKQVVDSGELYAEDALTYQYQIKIQDYPGNQVKITIPVKGTNDSISIPKKVVETDHFVYADQSFNFKEGKFEVYIPKGALYENAFMDFSVESDNLVLHNKELPVHKNVVIRYDLSAYKEADRSNLYIGRKGYKDAVYYVGARVKNGKLTASTRTLGEFTLGSDSVPPVITPKNVSEGKWMSKSTHLKFEIEDEDSGIKGYRATVNGNFILMEYDYKTKSLVHDFADNVVTDTENNFKLIVTDNVGNSTTFETKFYRKK